MKRFFITGSVALVLLLGPATPKAHAGFLDGVGDVVAGAFALPLDILSGTFSGPPVIGTVSGVLNGAMHTIGYTARGVFKLAGAAAPVAMSVAPFLPIFL